MSSGASTSHQATASPAPSPRLADWIYLASQSPRRRQLLDQIGVVHRLLLPEPGEDAEALEATRAGESPRDYVERVTRAKLAAARLRLQAGGLEPAPVLCADTTVALGAEILGKPADADEARAFLARLSGQTHRVHTCVALAWPGEAGTDLRVQTSDVRMRRLAADEIEAYVGSGEPFGKAGGYAIQSAAAAWIEHIAGSYSGIMGLPLCEVDALLRRA